MFLHAFTLKMAKDNFSETCMHIYQTTLRHIEGSSYIHSRLCSLTLRTIATDFSGR